MAKLVFGMNVSLDGYVNHDAFAPGERLFQHWIDHVRALTGSIYGRRLYEIMSYWDNDDAAWTEAHRDFAEAWRAMPKWVASQTLESVGPNATLIQGDTATAVRALKEELDGEISIGGPVLAHSMESLIDEYHLYLRPFVLGQGRPFFTGPLPPLRLVSHEPIGEDALRLIYAPG